MSLFATSAHEPQESYCGTTYAAKLLGMSVGTIQTLVEKGELQAWKTQGGHRRISMQSIYDYQRRNNMAALGPLRNEDRLRVMVVDDDESTRLMLQAQFDQWNEPLDVTLYASAMEALLDMFSLQPDVLLTDLRMPHVDGFEFLRTLSEHSVFQRLAVVVITGLSADEVAQQGGLPEGVQLMQKPLDLEWLKGFFHALMSMRHIDRRQRL